jgi:histidinol-phosphate aminotransferase
MDTSKFVRKNILNLEPYSTARDETDVKVGIFLDANESPFDNGFNRYPDPAQRELKRKIATVKGVPEASIFVGNGSDEAIDLCYRVFCEPGRSNAVSFAPSYGMYGVAAAMNDVSFREVALASAPADRLQDSCGDAFRPDVEKLLAACDSDTRLIFICSPNNPTGRSISNEQIECLLRRFDGIVVLDEAYIDFSPVPSMLPRLSGYPNLIILQTLSKAWGAAGLRIGMAFASPEIVGWFSKVKYPYNVDVASMRMAMHALDSDVAAKVEMTVSERGRVAAALAAIPSVTVFPSDANFLLVRFPDADFMYAALLGRGIIVRNRSRIAGCANCLRITIGTPSENDALISAVCEISSGDCFIASLDGTSSVADACHSSGTSEVDLVAGVQRWAEVHRVTNETDVYVKTCLDGGFESSCGTGLKFFDHMLDQIPRHSGIALAINAKGDLQVDQHHTMEDVGIALGEALGKALGDKRGIERYGFVLPMDECEAEVLIDLGGRIDFEWDVPFTREFVGDVPTEMFRHFFKSMCEAMKCNLHIKAAGIDNHHLAESVFKAFARALRAAVKRDAWSYDLPSSKGAL